MMMSDVPGEEYMLQNYNKGRGVINNPTTQKFQGGWVATLEKNL